jgi:hypothetical protein
MALSAILLMLGWFFTFACTSSSSSQFAVVVGIVCPFLLYRYLISILSDLLLANAGCRGLG